MPSSTNGRRRNERERQRVRSVNEGFERLRRYVPMSHQCQDASECVVATVNKVRRCQRRRCSKVDVLRSAIMYIRHLEGLLDGEELHWRSLKHSKTKKKKRKKLSLQPKQLTCTDTQLLQTRKLCISEWFQRDGNKSCDGIRFLKMYLYPVAYLMRPSVTHDSTGGSASQTIFCNIALEGNWWQGFVFIYKVKRTVATLLTAWGKAATAFC
jgi:hypothetical protein